MKTRNHNCTLEILGMDWLSGSLILVGGRAIDHPFGYVLGNVIANGTKEDIPVALFTPGNDRNNTIGALVYRMIDCTDLQNGQSPAFNAENFPVYVDDTTPMTIACLIDRIFRFVEEKDVRLVAIDRLQNIDGSLLDSSSKEREMNAILRILKAMAESLGIIIIVTSDLSDRLYKERRPPSIKDILDVTEAEEHCDQIILLQSLGFPHSERYKMILPLGLPYQDKKGGLVLNLILDSEKHYFKKVTAPFEEEDCGYEETPLYQWYPSNCKGNWNFEFLDSEGFAWLLTVEQLIEEDDTYYQIIAHGRPDENILLDDYVNLDDIELIKAVALEKVRERFPEVEIQEKPDN